MTEKKPPLTDPREIRKHLREVLYRGGRIDCQEHRRGLIAPVSGLVRHLMTHCEIEGMSGEDTWTIVAYHALLEWESAMDRLIDNAMRGQPVIVVPESPKL